MELTTDLYLVPRLSMRGAIPPLPLYAYMAWTWTTLTSVILSVYIFTCKPTLDFHVYCDLADPIANIGVGKDALVLMCAFGGECFLEWTNL
jgi:hypothetical protein